MNTYTYKVDNDDEVYKFETPWDIKNQDMVASDAVQHFCENYDFGDFVLPEWFEIFFNENYSAKYKAEIEYEPIYSVTEID